MDISGKNNYTSTCTSMRVEVYGEFPTSNDGFPTSMMNM